MELISNRDVKNSKKEESFNKRWYREAAQEEEPVQKKAADFNGSGLPNQANIFKGIFDKDTQSEPIQKKPNTTSDGLPEKLKTGIEAQSGISMDDVKVHYNSSRPAELDALAYTQGTDIHVAPGQEKHLPHEAWHVVQQKQGRVNPTMQMKSINVNDDDALEHEADVMGEKAVHGVFKGSPVQEKLIDGNCIQRKAHVKITDEINPDDKVKLIPSVKPTMVFETMGSDSKIAADVNKEAERYEGNTLCIFGYNKQVPTIGPKTEFKKDTHPSKIPHYLSEFAFVWEKPKAVEESMQYKMPFVEARILVMNKAEEISERAEPLKLADKRFDKAKGKVHSAKDESQVTEPQKSMDEEVRVLTEGEARILTSDEKSNVIIPKCEAENNAQSFIYRWIDGDARDDTSNSIPTEDLLEFSNDTEARLGTGTYDWRHENKQNKTEALDGKGTYHQFIEMINTSENTLRAYYYNSIRKNAIDIILHTQQDKHFGKENKDREKIAALSKGFHDMPSYKDGSYLPGFYLPEPTLMMNATAHQNMAHAFQDVREGAQDKESMKIAENSGVAPSDITFMEQLSVSKPLKNEFIATDDKTSYFFNGKMRDFFTSKQIPDIDSLKNALGGLRQSAFDTTKWKVNNEFRQAQIEIIYTWLSQGTPKNNNFLKIKKELEAEMAGWKK